MMNLGAAILCFSLLPSSVGYACSDTNSGNIILHVNPDAVMNGTGDVQRPFNTLQQARNALRNIRKEKKAQKRIEIVLHGGDYILRKSFRLEAVDSGTNVCPVVYRAAEGESPRLVGGIILHKPETHRITDKEILNRLPAGVSEHVRMIRLPENTATLLAGPVHRGMGIPVNAVGSEVIADGRILTRARWPNINDGNGFCTVDAILDAGSIPRNRSDDVPPEKRETGPERGGVFQCNTDHLSNWTTAENAWVMGYWRWDWADEQLPVNKIDVKKHTVRLGLPHRYGLHKNARFYICNLIEELDMPDEYYLDISENKLYLWTDNDTVPNEIIITTSDEPLFTLKNVSNVQFVGLKFGPTRGAGIRGTGVHNVHITDCLFSTIGTTAIDIDGDNNSISYNKLRDTGGTGISILGGDRATLTAADNIIADNDIKRFGRLLRTYHPGIEISGVGQKVIHNVISDAPHSAIIFYGNDHLIQANEIFRVLLETGDSGAIYCGRDWTLQGNIITCNIFHDLPGTDSRYQNAVYLDDMASGITVTSNIFYNCHWGMLVGGGRDISITNNIFIGGNMAIHFDARGIGWMAASIADPDTSTLHKRLARVPYREKPWIDRFPSLQYYLTDRFGRPVGSRFTGNAIYETALGTIDDRECVKVENNFRSDHSPFGITTDPVSGRLTFDRAYLDPAEPEGFIPIPTNAGPRDQRG